MIKRKGVRMRRRIAYILLGDLSALLIINLIRQGFGNIFENFLLIYKSIDFLFLYTIFISNIIFVIIYLIVSIIQKKVSKNVISKVIFGITDIIVFSFNLMTILFLYFMFGTSL